MRILFVCLGNICRSPTAEAVARQRLPELHVDSAGTSGWHVGEPPYGPMQKVAKARGYDLSPLRARGFVERDYDDFDLILCMDMRNVEDVEQMRPEGSQTPVRLLTSFVDGAPGAVPDPYYTRDFDGALTLIEEAVAGFAAWHDGASR